MKKAVLYILILATLATCFAGCNNSSTKDGSGNNGITSVQKKSNEKVIEYIKTNGTEYESGFCVSFQDYFLDDYNTYFIVYNTATDSFSLEYYSSDRYFDVPPKFGETNNAVKINLFNGEAKYYSDGEGTIYTGTALIDMATYNANNNKLQNVVIDGSEYKQITDIVAETFEKSVQNTITYINLFLSEKQANISVADLGFSDFLKETR